MKAQCTCVDELENAFLEDKRVAERVRGTVRSASMQNVNLIDGCTFTEVEVTFVKDGVTRRKKFPLMHSHCPHCGKEYLERGA